jgi:hypothetical protein
MSRSAFSDVYSPMMHVSARSNNSQNGHHTSNHQEYSHGNNSIVEDAQRNHLPRAVLFFPVKMEVEQAGKTKGKPTDENSGADVQYRAEYRNGVRYDEGYNPEERSNADPQCPGECVVYVDLMGSCFAHDSRVHVL